MVVEIFIAQGQAEYTLCDQIRQRVLDEFKKRMGGLQFEF